MELFFHVVDSLAGRKVTDETAWLHDAENSAVKLFNHLGTIRHLQHGTNLPIIDGRPRQYVDHSSISILARAAFETYLCYYYIYGDLRCDTTTKKLRHDIWSLGGLLDRQNATSVTTSQGISVLEQDRKVIARLLSDIKSNPAFDALTPKQKAKAENGKWRLDNSWVNLAEIAGFDTHLFRDMYSYLCSYAHSGGLSLLQVGQAVSINDQQYLSGLALQCAMILMSDFVLSYTLLFPDTRIHLEANAEMVQMVRRWHMTCRAHE